MRDDGVARAEGNELVVDFVFLLFLGCKIVFGDVLQKVEFSVDVDGRNKIENGVGIVVG